MFSGFAELVQALTRTVPNLPPLMSQLVNNFTQEAIQADTEAQAKTEGIQQAQKVTNYYATPIAKPAFPLITAGRPIRVNHKELLMLTGYFDPSEPSSDLNTLGKSSLIML
jgi:hypothetical protein